MVRWRRNAAEAGGREREDSLITGLPRDPSAAFPDDDRREADETTRLLGAGAGARAGATKDTWAGYEDFEGLPWWRTPSVYWLLGPYFLFTLAFGGIIVPKLNLILDLLCRHYFADQTLADPEFTFVPVILGGDNPQCLIPEVQKKVSLFTLVLNLATGVLSALVAPKLGHLSDRYGRKRLLALASCGGLLSEGVTILAAKYPDVVSYNWLVLGAMFDGLTGSFTAGSVLGHSYTSDCTPPSRRGVSIGYLHACLFTGLAFGPLLAGYFVKFTGSLLSIFYVAVGCHAFYVLFILLVLPESLSRKRQLLAREKFAQDEQEALARLAPGAAPPSWAASLRTSNPLAPLRILWPAAGPGATAGLRRNLVSFALIDTVLLGAAMGSMTVILLYCEYTFGWGTLESSRFISVISLFRVFILMGALPTVNYLMRTRPAARRRRESGVAAAETNTGADRTDVWLVRFAVLADMAGVTGYIFAPTGGVFVLCGVVAAVGGVGSPTIQAALTKHVPAEQVGQLLGAIGLLHALSRVLAPIAFNGLYYATVELFPQAIFVLLAALFGCALVASTLVRPHVYFEQQSEEGSEDEGRDLLSALQREGATSTETLEEEGIVHVA